MLTNVSDVQVDRKLSIEGIPVDIGDGRTVWIAQAGGFNRSFHFRFYELLEEERPGESDDDRRERCMMQAMAEELVTRWDGFECDCHGEAPADVEHVTELLSTAPDVREQLLSQSISQEDYRLPRDIKSDSGGG